MRQLYDSPTFNIYFNLGTLSLKKDYAVYREKNSKASMVIRVWQL